MTYQNTSRHSKGFTLIELLVTVVVAGVLAAIAISSYTGSVRKSRRATAEADLMENAQWMERQMTAGSGYPATTTALPVPVSPRTGTAYYNITISASNTTTFTLLATPTGSQAADGGLKLDWSGNRTWDVNNDSTFSGTW